MNATARPAIGKGWLGPVRRDCNFILDRANELGGNGDKLDAYSDSLEAIADLAGSLDHDAGSRKPEAKFQDRPLRIIITCIDEHAVRTKVRRPNTNVFLESLVNHGQFSELR